MLWLINLDINKIDIHHCLTIWYSGNITLFNCKTSHIHNKITNNIISIYLMKNYSWITSYLRKNVIYRKNANQSNNDWLKFYENKLQNDKVFKEIIKTVGLNNIYPVNIHSFSNYHSPNKIRIRSDLFLRNARKFILGDIFVIFACVNVDNVKTYVVITSNYFTSYSHSLTSSNSFFTKDFKDLIEWSKENGNYEVNRWRIKGIGEII